MEPSKACDSMSYVQLNWVQSKDLTDIPNDCLELYCKQFEEKNHNRLNPNTNKIKVTEKFLCIKFLHISKYQSQ